MIEYCFIIFCTSQQTVYILQYDIRGYIKFYQLNTVIYFSDFDIYFNCIFLLCVEQVQFPLQWQAGIPRICCERTYTHEDPYQQPRGRQLLKF